MHVYLVWKRRCPPASPHKGASVVKYSTHHEYVFGMETPLRGRSGGHTGTAPTHLHHIFPRGVSLPHHIAHSIAHANHAVSHTPPYCTFDSSKPRGVPLPHRGYTFDSAGLASATQPTLGNNASEEATPLGVVLFPPHYFLISSHTHRGRKCIAHSRPHSLKQVVYANWHRDDALLF